MKIKLKLLSTSLTLIYLLLPSVAKAQGVNIHDIALSNIGGFAKPVGGAVITVCQGTGVGTPCSPAALVYTSVTLGTTTSNIFNADNNGNYNFWIDPNLYNGQYVISITGVGVTGYTYFTTIFCTKITTCTETNKTFTSPTFTSPKTITGYNRVSQSGNTCVTASAANVSSGIGTAAITPIGNGEIELTGMLYYSQDTNAKYVVILLYRTTGSIPACGAAVGGSDVLLTTVIQQYIGAAANLNVSSFALWDTGLNTATAYKYYFTVSQGGFGGTATLLGGAGNTKLQATALGG